MTGAELEHAMQRLCYGNVALGQLLGVHRHTVGRWRIGAAPMPAPQSLYIRRLLSFHERHPPPPPPPGGRQKAPA